MLTWLVLIIVWQSLWVTETSVDHVSNNDTIQEYVDYAYSISNNDINFLWKLQWENGQRDPKKQSNCVKIDWSTDCFGRSIWLWYREESYWFCQINKRYHPDIVWDKRFFTDRRWQLQQCWEMYTKRPWAFYAYVDTSKFILNETFYKIILKNRWKK